MVQLTETQWQAIQDQMSAMDLLRRNNTALQNMVDDRDRRLAGADWQLRRLREIVQATAEYDATYCGIELGHECAFNAQQRARTGGQDFGCHWNKGEADRTRHMFIHGLECPVTKARAVLEDK